VRPSPTAGQASLEYVAVISLVAAVLVLAAPAVGTPSIAREVARAVRLGVCVAAHDYCRAGDAAAERLGPCTLGSRASGHESEVSLLSFRLGENDEWNVSVASDGSVSMVHAEGGSAALVAGVGAEVGYDVAVEAEASAGLRVQTMTGWRFADREAAKRFIAGLPSSARNEPPAWRSGALGGQAGAVAVVKGGGLDLGSLGAGAKLASGVRAGPGDTLTLFGEVSLSDPELRALGSQIAGLGPARGVLEYTFAGGEPTQLAFRTVVPGGAGKRATETLRRLDLRIPGNRFVAQPLLGAGMFRPPTPAYVRDLGRVLAWIETEGTIERATYDVEDSSKNFGFMLKAGEELGLSHTAIRVGQRLVDASAKVPGSKERSRFDCLDQLR
jgi:hypothetical protein